MSNFATVLGQKIEKEVEKRMNVFYDLLVEKTSLSKSELKSLWKQTLKGTGPNYKKMKLSELKSLCVSKGIQMKSKKKQDYVTALENFNQVDDENSVEEPVVHVEEPVVHVEEPEVHVEEPEVHVEEPEVHVEESEVHVEESEVPVEESEVPVEESEVPVEEPEVPVEEPVVESVPKKEKKSKKGRKKTEVSLEKVSEKIDELFEKKSIYELSLPELKKKCKDLGYDISKKKKTDLVKFLEENEKKKVDETFDEHLVDADEIL